ncbi:hypothetical protein ACFS5J_02500 [Flavobacterium chuncheonense]|uniref:Uncharacterized protein n=1 Tax=Flavobacterium chuncheonense TaxID=2026653 RepID=A0ABW5YJU7_9FLAO
MDKQSLFFTVLVGIISLILALGLLQIFINKKIKNDLNTRTWAFLMWQLSWIIPFFIFLKIALLITENTIETVIYSNTIQNTFFYSVSKILLYIGFTFLYTVFVNKTIDLLDKFFFSKSDMLIELENNNTIYFALKLILVIGFTLSISTVFEHFLNWFVPSIETPFYH